MSSNVYVIFMYVKKKKNAVSFEKVQVSFEKRPVLLTNRPKIIYITFFRSQRMV